LDPTVAVPTPEVRRGKSQNSPDVGAKGAIQESTAPLQQAVEGTDRTPSEGGRLLSHEKKLSKSDLPGLVPTRTESKLNAPEKSQKQPRKGDRTALKGAKTPSATPTSDPSLTPTKKGRRGQPPGPDTTQEPDGQISDTSSVIIGFIEFTNTVTSESIARREEQLSERYPSHATETPTLRSDGAGTALIEDPDSERQQIENIKGTAGTENTEQEPTLTKAQRASIDKRRRRQAKANGQGNRGTACFTADTYILVRKLNKASWIPIWTAKKGDIAVQSLPSGKIEDLSRAMMTPIKTLCTFECPEAGIDLVQMGKGASPHSYR